MAHQRAPSTAVNRFVKQDGRWCGEFEVPIIHCGMLG